MQSSKIKSTTIAIAILLTISLTTTIVLLPTVNAHTPPWTFVSYAYIVASPNPVGVGQTVSVVFWVDAPFPGASVTNDIRRHDYKLTITKPDGSTETKQWPVLSDSTGMQFYQYTPDQIGDYTFKFEYPGQTYTWTSSTSPGASSLYLNDVWLGDSKTITLTVQQDPIPASISSYPMPTEYWTRPIEGQNTYWYTIASNWLGAPYVTGAGASFGIPGAVQPDGAAPNSAHVMWTKPIQYGGVVGGSDTAVPGEMFYSGLSYNVRFANPLIIQGTLFYQEPYGNNAGGGYYLAVDLRTGKEIWRVNATATGANLVPSFGYLYSHESPNQHGVLSNGLLIASASASGQGTTWRGYDPRNGVLTTMNVTNVPSGTAAAGPSGELLRYMITNLGSSANPNWHLMQWNSSRLIGGGAGLSPANWYSGTVNASLPSAYDWNVSIPSLRGTGWTVGLASLGIIPLVNPGDKLLLVQGTFGGHPGDYFATVTDNPANITAISLKPGSIGQVLWSKTYQPATGNNTRLITDWDPANGVFVFGDKESMLHYGYSLTDGSQLWGPSALTDDFTTDYNYMAIGLERIAYGKLFFTGYSGILYAYDVKTGELLWTYGNGGAGNSTLSGFETPYGRYPTFISVIADGKVYLDTTEHSPNSPLYKGARFRAINATDGKEIWTILDYGNQMYGGQAVVADGYLATLNSYDSRIYVFGRGPSATTVTAPDIAATFGTPIVIKGTVLDVAEGTKQDEQSARFPYGVPAVSDKSMGAWMEYVYMQKPRPTDTEGVPVSIDVIDSNGNYRNIGETTSDANGAFVFTWTPDIEGTFTVIAKFAGSESYWPSHAESFFTVTKAPPTPSPYPTVTLPPLEMYILATGAAIIVAVVLVGAVLALMVKKRA
jgi:hypothetical protein